METTTLLPRQGKEIEKTCLDIGRSTLFSRDRYALFLFDPAARREILTEEGVCCCSCVYCKAEDIFVWGILYGGWN